MNRTTQLTGAPEHVDLRDLADELDQLREQRAEDGLDDDERGRLDVLEQLERDLCGYPAHIGDGLRGAAEDEPTMVREDCFTEYAKEFADSIGAVDAQAGWPNSHIDWEAAADELKADFAEVEFGGFTYYTRAG